MQDLAALCYQYQIPCFMAFALGDDPQHKDKLKIETLQDLKVVTYLPETLGIETKDRRFADLVNIINGFDAVPPHDRANFALEMDDLFDSIEE